MNISLLLFTLLLISLILNYLELNDAKTAIDIVNDMGIGINLGNLFDCYGFSKEIKTPNDQLTLLGNSIPKKETIKKLKTSGIKTIRLPITWINFINETGIVSTEWMNQVKEIVQLIINYNMYCIINIHHDGAPGNWLSKGLDSKAQFDLLWTQISNEFKDFDDHLIFEAMNEVEYKIGDKYDYSTLLILTQSFIDIVRNSGGNNYERLLLIPGANDDYQLTISDEFQIPIDPANTFAISIHYYIPYEFTKQLNNDENLTDNPSRNTWGNALDYDEIMTDFYMMKITFVDKGIPIIIGEVGVVTEDGKDEDSLREFLYAVTALSWEFDGIISCFWDTSNKETGNMNYYNREKNDWYDNKIKNFIKQISKGKYVTMWDYFIYTNSQNFTSEYGDYIEFYLDDLTPQKITFCVNPNGEKNLTFIHFFGYTENYELFEISYDKKNYKKQYDGTIIYSFDISNINIYYCLYAIKSEEYINVDLIYVLFETKEYFNLFDYFSYKNAILNAVNKIFQ